jgi:hypothetical protein
LDDLMIQRRGQLQFSGCQLQREAPQADTQTAGQAFLGGHGAFKMVESTVAWPAGTQDSIGGEEMGMPSSPGNISVFSLPEPEGFG